MSNLMTKEEMKKKAVENLISLKCFPAYKEAFRRSGIVTMYEGCGGYYVDEISEPELFQKIEEVQNEYGGLVYAVIHNHMEYGDCYSMLWQTSYDESPEAVSKHNGINYVFAYVWNKTDDFSSEFGTIGVIERLGGFIRVA